ncbi:hypothetical protein GCM10010431_81640 [Streptomyces kunmingensis]
MKDGPPVVMPGDHAPTRVPFPAGDGAAAADADPSGPAARTNAISAPAVARMGLWRRLRPAAPVVLLENIAPVSPLSCIRRGSATTGT